MKYITIKESTRDLSPKCFYNEDQIAICCAFRDIDCAPNCAACQINFQIDVFGQNGEGLDMVTCLRGNFEIGIMKE